MKNISSILCRLIFVALPLMACGGGGSSSGGSSVSAPPPPAAPIPDPGPITVAGEGANECMDDIQVRLNRTALVRNICGFDINVGQMNSRFPGPPPITLVAAGQIKAVQLADDQTTIGFGACKAPSIPMPTSPGFYRCSSYTQGKQSEQTQYPLRYAI